MSAPNREDVRRLVEALFTVTRGLERGRRRNRDAASLAVLGVVASGEAIRPSDIAAEMQVDQSLVTRQVRALEEAGHVQVSADPSDGRSCLITLTDLGTEEWRRLTEIGLRRFSKFVAGWTSEDVRTLTELLWRFETSKAEVGRQEQRSRDRGWRQQAMAGERPDRPAEHREEQQS
jgi:DNA-binding MarR family transcriptional regulator